MGWSRVPCSKMFQDRGSGIEARWFVGGVKGSRSELNECRQKGSSTQDAGRGVCWGLVGVIHERQRGLAIYSLGPAGIWLGFGWDLAGSTHANLPRLLPWEARYQPSERR